VTMPIGPVVVYRDDDFQIVATFEGTLLGWVPLCSSSFVEEPLLVNLTVNSLDEVVVETVIKVPSLMADIEGTVQIDQLWFSTEEPLKSKASVSVEFLASFTATDFLLENPSENKLTAVITDTVSVSIDIREIGLIQDFTFIKTDSDLCSGVIDICPSIEDFLYDTYDSELEELLLQYLETKVVELQPELEVAAIRVMYTEIDSVGLNAICVALHCDGMTVGDFVDRIVLVFWLHVALLCIPGVAMCYFCILFRRERVKRNAISLLEVAV